MIKSKFSTSPAVSEKSLQVIGQVNDLRTVPAVAYSRKLR